MLQMELTFLRVIINPWVSYVSYSKLHYSRASQRNNGNLRSEARLCFSCGGTLMFVAGLFWFG